MLESFGTTTTAIIVTKNSTVHCTTLNLKRQVYHNVFANYAYSNTLPTGRVPV